MGRKSAGIVGIVATALVLALGASVETGHLATRPAAHSVGAEGQNPTVVTPHEGQNPTTTLAEGQNPTVVVPAEGQNPTVVTPGEGQNPTGTAS